MNMHILFRFILLSAFILIFCADSPPELPADDVIPSERQIEYQQMELIGFVHFSMNTFTDREWGYGDESPDLFNPTDLNTRQWAETAKAAGMKQLILTAKHHDGFCLWPSVNTAHSVKNSPWKEGKGDVVREFVDACREYGLKAGLYLSPWDRNHPEYGRTAYLTYYKNQLEELLTRYGEISEIWFDGANGGTGYYGGANEERRIDRTSYYRWPEIWQFVKQLQPDILIFSDAGPDIRWIGNEHGFAGETNWSRLTTDDIIVGGADTRTLNTGDPEGEQWVVGECDVSIRPGWFYHADQDSLVKSPEELVDIYYKSVGRNGVFLLNIPPDRRGRFHENDVTSLKQFRTILNKTFRVNLAEGKRITASNTRLNDEQFAPEHILDNDPETYWSVDDKVDNPEFGIDLGEKITFDRIMVAEPIRFGQKIEKFSIMAHLEREWIEIAWGTTIGYKRLLRIKPVHTDRVKLIIRKSKPVPAISDFGLYRSFGEEGK